LLLVVVAGGCRFGFEQHEPNGDGGRDGVMVDVQPPSTFVPNWHNGTRIRAIVYRAVDGGDPHWFNWRDTKLDMDCYPAMAADGAERCVPQIANAATFYADVACTQRLIHVPANLCNRNIKYGSAIITGQYHVFPLGAPYTGTTYDIRTGCMPTTVTTGQLYTAGAESDPAIFEPVNYHTEIVGDFSRTFQGFPDGAALEIGNLNFNIGSCYMPDRALGPSRCASQFTGSKVFIDAGCTQAAFLADDAMYFGVYEPKVCAPSYELYQRTADVTQATYWEQTPSGCTMQTTPVDKRLVQALPMANPYPIGTIIPGPDRGRIGTLYWVGPDGAAMVVRAWDQQLQRTCRPFVAGDNKMRCLPDSSPRKAVHLSSDCSDSSQLLAVDCFPTAAAIDGPTYTSCEDPPWPVANLAKVTDTPRVASGTSCVAQSTPAFDPSVPAGTLSPSMFPELTFTVD
jgi:hypothetical protein